MLVPEEAAEKAFALPYRDHLVVEPVLSDSQLCEFRAVESVLAGRKILLYKLFSPTPPVLIVSGASQIAEVNEKYPQESQFTNFSGY